MRVGAGRRVCLVGAFALDNVRDRFADQVRGYFAKWRRALAAALEKAGNDTATAGELAEEAVIAIQGALVLARALDDTAVFERRAGASRDAPAWERIDGWFCCMTP